MGKGDQEDTWSGEEETEEEVEVETTRGRAALPLIPLAGLLGLSVLVFVHFFTSQAPTVPQPIQTVTFETPSHPIKVYLVGEVEHPGVVSLSSDGRVEDAIKMAGGFTDKADQSAVNLAAKLGDAEMVRVPARGAKPEATPSESLTPSEVETPVAVGPPPAPEPRPTHSPAGRGHFQGGPVEPPGPELTPPPPPLFNDPGPPAGTPTPPPLPPEGDATPPTSPAPVAEANPSGPRVSLNRGSVEQFQQVPGIDEALASAIVAYRRGPPPRAFTSMDELGRVPGFQGGRLDAFLPYLKL